MWDVHDFVMAINLPTPATDNPLSSPGVIVCWFFTRATDLELHRTSVLLDDCIQFPIYPDGFVELAPNGYFPNLLKRIILIWISGVQSTSLSDYSRHVYSETVYTYEY